MNQVRHNWIKKQLLKHSCFFVFCEFNSIFCRIYFMINTPKINLLYYKNILDLMILEFFDKYNDLFIKQDGLYVFSANFSKSKLKSILNELFINAITKYVTEFDLLNPNYYFIISSCLPKDNLLLSLRTKEVFPKKLDLLLTKNINYKYILVEKDIKIDFSLFNQIFIEIFNKYFLNSKNVLKDFGPDYKNIFFIQHNRLDCYMLFKIIKNKFGDENCINIWKSRLSGITPPLVAVNDIISQKIIGKQFINKLPEFKRFVKEVYQYVDGCISTISEKSK